MFKFSDQSLEKCYVGKRNLTVLFPVGIQLKRSNHEQERKKKDWYIFFYTYMKFWFLKRYVLFFSVENYLNEIHSQALQAATGVNAIPTGAHIRDDEQVRLFVWIPNCYCLWNSSYKNDTCILNFILCT